MIETIESQYLEVKATGLLPSPTGVALTILKITQQDDFSIEEVARAIQSDPAMAGRILKFVNSSFYANARPIISITEAVLRIGVIALRQLLLGLSVLSRYRQGYCESFDYQKFWAHSLATAVASQSLCQIRRVFPHEEAFTCGLLSHVGRLALATVYPREYGEVLGKMGNAPACELLPVEKSCLRVTHLDLTQALLKEWGLSDAHYNAIRGLYTPDDSGLDPISRDYQLARVLSLSSELGSILVAEEHLRPAMMTDLMLQAEWFELDLESLQGLFDEVVAKWREWSALLEMPALSLPAFGELMDSYKKRTAGLNTVLASTGKKQGLRILLVDYDSATRKIVEGYLLAASHTVIMAKNGDDALRLAMETEPQLIITDWVMPEMDGLEFCRALRRTRIGQNIYFIIMTAWEDEERLLEAFEAGVDDYLEKPIKPNVLRARICGGERLIKLQEEVNRDKREIHRFIADFALLNRRLEQAALSDPLTQLPNRRYATRRLDQQWSAAKRSDGAITCMVVDVDHFKGINDKYGHAGGDTALIEVAKTLRNAARKDDVVCRIGGEEFLIICTNTDAEAAQATAERMRVAVEQCPVTLADIEVKLTISVGVAAHTAKETTPDELLRAADMAVYAAKSRGRNRVCLIAGVLPKNEMLKNTG
jgi:diguanylate cyclase (GGDEF)-like protein